MSRTHSPSLGVKLVGGQSHKVKAIGNIVLDLRNEGVKEDILYIPYV